jgi:hypothetical protein
MGGEGRGGRSGAWAAGCGAAAAASRNNPLAGRCPPGVPVTQWTAHLFWISGRRAPHLRLPTKRFFTARLVRPGRSIEMAFQLLPYRCCACTTTATSHSEKGLLRGCSMSGLRKLRHLGPLIGRGRVDQRGEGVDRVLEAGGGCAVPRAPLNSPTPCDPGPWAVSASPSAPVAAALAAAPGHVVRHGRPGAVAILRHGGAQQVVLLRRTHEAVFLTWKGSLNRTRVARGAVR